MLFCQTDGSNSALLTFGVYTLVVLGLAVLSSRIQKGKGFLSEYFLGSRNLGMWAFALTFAATSASGGSFTGFPSLIYSHGWSLALWIASYMLVPAIMMGLLGKRLNQMARKTNAITIPDVLAARLDSVGIRLLSTALIIFFMTFNLVAQFKAGAVMLSTLLDSTPLYRVAIASLGSTTSWQDPGYVLCLLFFAVAVIVYTSYGGFRAVVWTDVLQGIVMVIGVIILLPLTLHHVGGLDAATKDLAKMVPPQECMITIVYPGNEPDSPSQTTIEFGDWVKTKSEPIRVFRTGERRDPVLRDAPEVPSIEQMSALEIRSPHEVERILASDVVRQDLEVLAVTDKPYAFGADTPGVYVSAPGPSADKASGFLPIAVAFSFFFFWTFSGAGQPSNMVRLMAFNNTLTLRRAIITVSIYFSLIYFPLVIIFCCARVLMPGMEIESDRIMPAMAEHVTSLSGVPWLAGLLVAAPFAAVMSTVDSFLLMISSAIVRDVYQQQVNPNASETAMKRLTYVVTACVGLVALVGALNPPRFLQDIIVFTGGGLSACFLVPVAFSLYWPRFNATGAIAGMLAGFVSHLAFHYLKVTGQLTSIDPFVPELVISAVAAVAGCMGRPPTPQLIEKFFRS